MVVINQTGEGNNSTATVLAVLAIVLLAVLAWFFFARGGPDRGPDVKVDINPPAATSGGNGGGAPK